MHSLQRPRKITVYGDDGGVYSFLCKPKDDLRKDARLMEFNSMIIKLLKKDGDARSRRLGACFSHTLTCPRSRHTRRLPYSGIRTYAVVPLNEDCGLIEWVPHVVVLRGILNKLYASRGVTPWVGRTDHSLRKKYLTVTFHSPESRAQEDVRHDPRRPQDDRRPIRRRSTEEVSTKTCPQRRAGADSLSRRFPPVFHEWFLETFPEPSAWLRARLAYSRTAAVMSMVGFVLGCAFFCSLQDHLLTSVASHSLGDRHCENILLDGTTGDTVHVDFNCLFDRVRL